MFKLRMYLLKKYSNYRRIKYNIPDGTRTLPDWAAKLIPIYWLDSKSWSWIEYHFIVKAIIACGYTEADLRRYSWWWSSDIIEVQLWNHKRLYFTGLQVHLLRAGLAGQIDPAVARIRP